MKRELLLLLSLALTAVGVAAGGHFGEVANHSLENGSDACDKKDETDPVVPYIRCNHDSQRSQ